MNVSADKPGEIGTEVIVSRLSAAAAADRLPPGPYNLPNTKDGHQRVIPAEREQPSGRYAIALYVETVIGIYERHQRGEHLSKTDEHERDHKWLMEDCPRVLRAIYFRGAELTRRARRERGGEGEA